VLSSDLDEITLMLARSQPKGIYPFSRLKVNDQKVFISF